MTEIKPRLAQFLLVEDDHDHAHFIKRVMKKHRITNEVIHLTDGMKAIEYLSGIHQSGESAFPDVILLDVKMPRLNGYETIQEIRKLDPCRYIPVVMMSTSSVEEDVSRAYQLQANAFVQKPFDPRKFRQLIIDLSLFWSVWNIAPGAATQQGAS